MANLINTYNTGIPQNKRRSDETVMIKLKKSVGGNSCSKTQNINPYQQQPTNEVQNT